jgi:hypothetical protein
MRFQGYLERGFAAEAIDIDNLTALLGHAPLHYKAFAQETAEAWGRQQQEDNGNA